MHAAGALLVLFSLTAVAHAAPPTDSGDDRRAISPGREELLLQAVQTAGLVCADQPGCDFDIQIERFSIRVDDRGRRFELAFGAEPPASTCLRAPSDLWVCAPSAAASEEAARDAMSALRAHPDQAEVIASMWDPSRGPHQAFVKPTARLLDGMLGTWAVLLLVVFAATLWRRPRPQRRADGLTALALLLVALALRLVPAAGPSLWYFPAAPEGPIPGVYTVSVPPVLFDALYRLTAWLPFGDESWFLGAHIALGTLPPALLFVAVRAAGARLTSALAFGALVAASPFLIWVARSDSYHAWPVIGFAAAFLGFVAPGPPGASGARTNQLLRWAGLALAALSLVIGVAARLETGLGLFWAGAFAVAIALSRAQDRTYMPRGRVLLSAAVTVAAAVAAFFVCREAIETALTGHKPPDESFYPGSLSATVFRGLTLRDTLLPTWAWATLVAPALALGLASFVGRRRWLELAATLAGLTLALALLLATDQRLEHTGNWRYVVLAFPYGLWLAAEGWATISDWLAARTVSAVSAAVPCVVAVALFASALGSLDTTYAFEAEFRFLRTNLGRLPAGCTVTAIQGTDGRPGLADLFLALPYAPLALGSRDIRWEVTPPTAVPTLPSGTTEAGAGCHAVYRGAVCGLRDQGLGEAGRFHPHLNSLLRDVAPACAALDARRPADGVTRTRFELTPTERPPGVFPEGYVDLELWRLR